MIDLGRTTSGDLDLTSNGGRGRRVAGAEAVAQFIRTRLQALAGGWWRNTSHGLRGDLLYRKTTTAQVALQVLMDEVRDVPGVVRLGDDWVGAIEGRTFSYSGTAYAEDEQIAVSAIDESGLGLVVIVDLHGPILG